MGRNSKRRPGSAPSRPVQVGEQIRHVLGQMLGDGSIKDPRIQAASMVTVTDVRMTPDLKLARAYISVFPDDQALKDDVFVGLRSAGNQMKREIGRRLGLRFTPNLEFLVDDSIANGARIEEILREVRPPPEPPSPEEDGSDGEMGRWGDGEVDEVS